MGGPSLRKDRNHKEVVDLYNKKYEQAREVYKVNNMNFNKFKASSLYEQVGEELDYAPTTVRIIICNYPKANRTTRQLHKDRICQLSLKKTSVGI